MATKKTTSRSKKKKQKKTAKRTVARKKIAKAARLTAAEKRMLLKPGEDLDEIVADTIAAWRMVPRKVRVANLSAARLESLLRRAEKASQKERELAAKQAAKLAPLTDARLRTVDEAYRMALKVKRIADAVAATDVDVADAFAAVNERFVRAPRESGDPGPG